MEEKVKCRTPTKGKSGVTNIPKWKFDAIRTATLAELDQGDIAFSDLTEAIRSRLTDTQLEQMGSLGWHITSVKLELEVRGDITRCNKPGAQVLTRV